MLDWASGRLTCRAPIATLPSSSPATIGISLAHCSIELATRSTLQMRRSHGRCSIRAAHPVGASATITVTDPPSAGIVNIKLTGATTATLAPGHYTEALRITRAGKTSTFQGLSIIVMAANPFAH